MVGHREKWHEFHAVSYDHLRAGDKIHLMSLVINKSELCPIKRLAENNSCKKNELSFPSNLSHYTHKGFIFD